MSLDPSKLRSYHRLAVERPSTTSWAPIMASDCAMLADAVEIADSCARADIECNVQRHSMGSHGSHWYDINTADAEDMEGIGQAVRYLESRDLLIRKEGAPHIVSFRTSE